MATDAARKAVFNTPELLENIISFLPQSDILKAQRLSRRWNTAISSSPSIQIKLWLRPRNPPAIPPIGFTNESTFTKSASWGRVTMPIYSREVLFNPLCFDAMMGSVELVKALNPSWLFQTANNTFLHPQVIEIFLHNESGQHGHQPIDASRGSWRNMYLTDPPITTCIIRVRHGGRYPHRFVPMAIRDHGGLTLGLAYDTIMAGLASSAGGKVVPVPTHVATFYAAFE